MGLAPASASRLSTATGEPYGSAYLPGTSSRRGRACFAAAAWLRMRIIPGPDAAPPRESQPCAGRIQMGHVHFRVKAFNPARARCACRCEYRRRKTPRAGPCSCAGLTALLLSRQQLKRPSPQKYRVEFQGYAELINPVLFIVVCRAVPQPAVPDADGKPVRDQISQRCIYL